MVNTMRSKVISCRIPENLYEKFEDKYHEERVSQTIKLRKLFHRAYHDDVDKAKSNG